MSIRRWIAAGALAWAAASSAAAAEVQLAIVRTAQMRTPEALVFSGGRWGHEVTTNFSAFVIRHGATVLLFDAGLGRRGAEQYRQDMPWWNRPAFRYPEAVQPAREQLVAAGIAPPSAIVLSHAHWDHASALVDFSGTEVWLAPAERAFVAQPRRAVGAAWPSQVAAEPIAWKPLAFAARAHEGFDQSLDVFGDGSVVIVAMPGHTPGSVGVFVTTGGGRRYFLVGDVVWHHGALTQAEARPKFWLARDLADSDGGRTLEMVGKIRAAMRRDPALTVIPAHDGDLQDRLGVLPRWLP